MDLDQFKIVNDTCGHVAGDELLRQLSTLFKQHVRDLDSIARVGGDEFVILLYDCVIDKAHEIAERLRQEVSDYKFSWDSKIFSVGISIGIVPVDSDTTSSIDVLSLADNACYAAKDRGRNRIVVHQGKTSDISERQSEMELAGTIRQAIDKNEFVLYRQRIEGVNRTVEGEMYEILVRLPSNGKILLPGEFIPAAERFDSVENLDYWVVDSYLKWLLVNKDAYENLFQANINISARTLGRDGFEEYLLSKFQQYNVSKSKVCFEITESEAISNLSKATEILNRLVACGFQFSLDDFGSGLSSYSVLKMLPVMSLKIDGSFVRDIEKDPIDKAMVKSIVYVAHAMDLQVVAEFVESEAVYKELKKMEIDFVQGYYVHKPEELI